MKQLAAIIRGIREVVALIVLWLGLSIAMMVVAAAGVALLAWMVIALALAIVAAAPVALLFGIASLCAPMKRRSRKEVSKSASGKKLSQNDLQMLSEIMRN